jgi:hypothetical protein
VDEHRVSRFLQCLQLTGLEHPLGRRRVDAHAPNDRRLFPGGRKPDQNLHEEPVALRFGQRVHTLALDGILRGQNHERLGHRMRHPADRDLPLGHHLEEGRLHLGRGSVDLVRQYDVGEDRAELDVEPLTRGPVDAGADDVGRHEVGRELQPHERAADDGGQRLGSQRLGQAGGALEEAVASGDESHEQALDDPILPDDDPLDLEDGPLDGLRLRRHQLAGRVPSVTETVREEPLRSTTTCTVSPG